MLSGAIRLVAGLALLVAASCSGPQQASPVHLPQDCTAPLAANAGAIDFRAYQATVGSANVNIQGCIVSNEPMTVVQEASQVNAGLLTANGRLGSANGIPLNLTVYAPGTDPRHVFWVNFDVARRAAAPDGRALVRVSLTFCRSTQAPCPAGDRVPRTYVLLRGP